MHVCYLAFDYPSKKGGGGVGTVVQTLARGLVREGNSVSVIAFKRSGDEPTEEDHGVRVYRINRGPIHFWASKIPVFRAFSLGIREIEDGLIALRTIRAIETKSRIDLIEGIETGATVLGMTMSEKPLLIRLHGEEYSFQKYTPGLGLSLSLITRRFVQRLSLRQATGLVSVSVAHGREIGRELMLDDSRIAVVYNPLPNVVARLPKLPALSAPIVLFVGRLEPRKGILLLLEAARLVVDRLPEVRFEFAGAPHFTMSEEALRERVRELDLGDHVAFLGHLPRNEVAQAYAKARVCVLPSYYETFGMAAVEPGLHGRPVVVTAGGALPEVVADGMTGLVVPVGNAGALADALINVLMDPVGADRMGRSAHSYITGKFDAEKILKQNLLIYDSIVRWSMDAGKI